MRKINPIFLVGAGVVILAGGITAAGMKFHIDGSPSADAGRYIVRIASCNDCHTAGWLEKPGTIPEADWLTGGQFGWQGPWGTTYPSNLRLVAAKYSEDEFLKDARKPDLRPPMAVDALRNMSDDDLRSIYRFIKSLGVKGTDAPEYVPPGMMPKTPYVVMAPPTMPGMPPGSMPPPGGMPPKGAHQGH